MMKFFNEYLRELARAFLPFPPFHSFPSVLTSAPLLCEGFLLLGENNCKSRPFGPRVCFKRDQTDRFPRIAPLLLLGGINCRPFFFELEGFPPLKGSLSARGNRLFFFSPKTTAAQIPYQTGSLSQLREWDGGEGKLIATPEMEREKSGEKSFAGEGSETF